MSPTTTPTIATVVEADTPDDAAGVLAAVRASKIAEDTEALRQMEYAVLHASFNSIDSIHHPDAATLPGTEGEIALAGEGAPLVAEFAVTELAAALGRSLDSARLYLGDCLELAHRLPKTWAATRAGRVAGWKARRIASRTKTLPPDGAAWVDTQIASVAGKIGTNELDRVITEAIVRFDPERAAEEALARLDDRHVDITLDPIIDGAICNGHLTGTLDAADALDLDATLSGIAAQLGACGSLDSLDARRAQALGHLARGEYTLTCEATSSDQRDGGNDHEGSGQTGHVAVQP